MMRPPRSTTVMFLPISPRPPSGRMRMELELVKRGRARSLCGATGEHQPVALEGGTNRSPLRLARRDHRQAQAAVDQAKHLQRRLHRDWVRSDVERCVNRLEA